jgi:hypothetical protein
MMNTVLTISSPRTNEGKTPSPQEEARAAEGAEAQFDHECSRSVSCQSQLTFFSWSGKMIYITTNADSSRSYNNQPDMWQHDSTAARQHGITKAFYIY